MLMLYCNQPHQHPTPSKTKPACSLAANSTRKERYKHLKNWTLEEVWQERVSKRETKETKPNKQ